MHFLLHLWRNRCVTQLCFFPESICLGEHKHDLFPRRNMTAFLSWLMVYSFRSEKWLCIWSTQHLCSTRLSFPGLAVALESFTLILPIIYCVENLRISSSAFLIIWCRGPDFPESGLYEWGMSWSAFAAGAVCSRLDPVCADCSDEQFPALPLLPAWVHMQPLCSEALGWSLGCSMHWKAGKSPCFV